MSNFPKHEVYGLTSQSNRAAVSVAANIAEGVSRQSLKDQAHFSEIAYGSLMELACLFIIGRDVGVLTDEQEADYANPLKKFPLNLTRYTAISATASVDWRHVDDNVSTPQRLSL